MSLFRANALRSIQTSARQTSVRVGARSANRQTQLVAKRFASSGGHGEHKASSDLPWLLGGIAVTVPTCYYLWPSSSHAEAGHHGHGDEHEEKHEEKEEQEDAPAEEESSDSKADEEKPSEEGDDSAKESDKEDSKDEEDGEGATEVDGPDDKKKSKGKVSADSDGADDTRKVESDSKGASKKRIDSGLAKNLGEGSSSKEPLSSTSKKQAGMSNTDTKHSIQIDEDPEKSKKGEGAPETAKLKGAVDPSRPQK